MTVSFTLSPQQQELKTAVRTFARTEFPGLMALVRAEPDPRTRAQLLRPTFEKAVAAGLLRGLIPVPFGGSAASGVDAAIFVEEWAAESPDFTIALASPLIALAPVYEAGTPDQIGRFVAPFLATSGAPVAAMAFSEPAGSANFDAPAPAAGILTTAVRDGEDWIVNGTKAWASHLCGWDGDGPDLMTIVCRTAGGVSLIVAEREHLAGHIEVEEYLDLPALRGCMTTRIRLRDVRVPAHHLLGREGDGPHLVRGAFMASGASIGLFAVAAMRQAWDIAYRFAQAQTRGGAVPIIEHQAVSDVLADTKGKIEAARLLGWRAMDAVLSRHPAAAELALHSKIFGSETGVAVVNDLIKVVGVSAYNDSFPILRFLSEALAYPLIEGSNTGVRRRWLQELFTAQGFDPLAASGLS